MLATDGEKASSGTAYVSGASARQAKWHVRQNTGYSGRSSDDARLCDHLTLGDTLRLIAGVRGLDANELTAESIDELVEALRLDEHQHKLVKHLSAGAKRTLSAALAFVGRPPLVVLDEVCIAKLLQIFRYKG